MDSRDDDKKREEAAIVLQRHIRSVLRSDFHLKIFKQEPVYKPPLLCSTYPDKALISRIQAIISDLASKQKIVNGSRLYHYTSLENLTSIVTHNKWYGNRSLQLKKIKFDENCMTMYDIKHGDGNIICFCPGQVDPLAYRINSKMKKNICRLSVDINNRKTDQTTFNQFFKLCDFGMEFTYQFRIGELGVKCNFNFAQGIQVWLSLGEIECPVFIPQNETVYYGNIYNINQFCLIQLFNLLEKISNQHIKNKFYAYISTLNDNEIRKLLTIFAQNITLFSEFNFNVCLPLNEIKIKDILILGDGKKKIDLEYLSDDEYKNVLSLLSSADYDEIFHDYGEYVYKSSTITQIEDDSYNLFGSDIDFSSGFMQYDFSELEANFFNSDEYIETRFGVSPQLDRLMRLSSDNVLSVLMSPCCIQ